MAGIFDVLKDLFSSNEDIQKQKRIEAARKANAGGARNVISPDVLLNEQKANGVPVGNFMADQSLLNDHVQNESQRSYDGAFGTANAKAKRAAEQAAIDAENERIAAEELNRQKNVFLGGTNSKANSHDLKSVFDDNQKVMDFRDQQVDPDVLTGYNTNKEMPKPVAPEMSADDVRKQYMSTGSMGDLDKAQKSQPSMFAETAGVPEANIPVDTGILNAARRPDSTNPVPIDTGILQALQASKAGQTPSVPVADDPRRPASQLPTGNVKPSAGEQDNMYGGIFPTLKADEAAKYGQFPAAPDPSNPGKPVDPTTTSATTANKPSDGLIHLGKFSFDPSVIGPALAVLDPRNSSLAGGLLDRVDARRKDASDLAEKQANQSALKTFLVNQGMSDSDADAMSKNPDVANEWYKVQQKLKNPGATEYGLSPQYVKLKDGSTPAVQVSKDGSGVIYAATGEKVDPSQIDSWIDPATMQGMKNTAKNTSNAQFNLPEVASAVDRVDQRVSRVIANPNIGAIVGPVDSRTPDLRSGSVELRGYVNELMADNFLSIRSKLKGQGAITDFESARAEGINRIQSAMGAGDPEVLKRALLDFQDFVHKWAAIAEQQAGAEPGSAGGYTGNQPTQSTGQTKSGLSWRVEQ